LHSSKILGAAEDKAAYKTTGGKGGSGGGKAPSKNELTQQLSSDFKNKMTLGTAIKFYSQWGLSNQDVYNQYKNNGIYKPTAAQAKADQKKYNVK
jgi:hypothetical protein